MSRKGVNANAPTPAHLAPVTVTVTVSVKEKEGGRRKEKRVFTHTLSIGLNKCTECMSTVTLTPGDLVTVSVSVPL